MVGRVDLERGVVASISRCRAPFPDQIGARFSWFLEGVFEITDKPDLFVTNAAKGLMEDTARNDFAWAEVDGEIVATVWTMTPADEPRLATLGEVYTDPALRRRGLARAVCAALLDRFDGAGGRVIFLGTEPGSPPARIYRRLGFEPYPRGLMRRERPIDGAFDATWFAPSAVTVRPMTWGDVPRIVQLYATPSPWQSVCWMQGIYAAGHVIHDRCNSLVKHTWQATRPGVWLGMFNREGALVGTGPMEPRGNEKAPVGADVDLFVHPAFVGEAGTLLGTMLAEARRTGWRWLRAELGDADAEKRAVLEGVGFREVARLPDALSIGGELQAVRILQLALA